MANGQKGFFRSGGDKVQPTYFVSYTCDFSVGGPRSTNGPITLRFCFFGAVYCLAFLRGTLSLILSPTAMILLCSLVGMDERTPRFVANRAGASFRAGAGVLGNGSYLERCSVHLSSRCSTTASATVHRSSCISFRTCSSGVTLPHRREVSGDKRIKFHPPDT